MKKKAKNSINSQESNQIHYQLGHLKTPHKKFISETKLKCTYCTFPCNILFFERKPGPTDWGTCLSMTCVNPEVKLEKLYHYKKINQIVLEDEIHDDQSFKTLLNTLDTF